jgi:hypothetical protein
VEIAEGSEGWMDGRGREDARRGGRTGQSKSKKVKKSKKK